jgi:hemoglobin-like flavoprotein
MTNTATTWLSKSEAALIRASFIRASAIPGQVSALFYQRLFELDPTLRRLFHGDMHEQGRKLVSTLSVIVESAEHLEQLEPTVRELGARHANYGVKSEHYGTVGEALLWALERTAKPLFNKATRSAWTKAYGGLAATMIAAANEANKAS